jgi:molecular chaperone HscA
MNGCCQEKIPDKIAFGIDFGTSNCLISYVDLDSELKFIRQKNSTNNLIPSEISFSYDRCLFANDFCGKDCDKVASGLNANAIKSIKRIIGLNLKEVLDIESFLPFKIKKFDDSNLSSLNGGEHNRGDSLCEINNSGPYTVISSSKDDEIGYSENDKFLIDCGNNLFKSVDEIILEMMKQLKQIIFHHFDIRGEKKIEIHSVITVPAYFDEKARNIIKKNALLAGIIVIRLINEPTAAALSYSKINLHNKLEDNKSYLVYDLGGGTFDISVIKKYKNDFFRVLGIGGDKFLGGDDFDKLIAQALHEKGLMNNQNEKIILESAKKIKENFNSEKYFTDEEFKEILLPTLNKTFNIMDSVIDEVVEKFDDLEVEFEIDAVILVGGSTRLPIIKEILSKKFKKIFCDHNPDEIVAYGAGLHAYEILHKTQQHQLLDAIGMSFGLEVSGDAVEVLIEKNSPVPISKTQIFTTQIDNQKQMRIAICQGENKKFSENILLGKYSLDDLPSGPAHSLQIEVTFSVDVDGILSVTAKELKSQKAIFVNFNNYQF